MIKPGSKEIRFIRLLGTRFSFDKDREMVKVCIFSKHEIQRAFFSL